MTMVRRVSRGRRGFGRGRRSPTAWSGVIAIGTLASASKVLLASFTPSGAGGSHETVVRQVGAFSVDMGAAAGSVILATGVFSDTAIGVGIVSLPDPVTDIADDLWGLFQPMGMNASRTRFEFFDQRGMRKVEEGQSLALILANSSLATISFSVCYRVLGKVVVMK